jgi:hypothetical protein
MAETNPMGGGRAVPLDLPALHIAILRDSLGDCLEGTERELEAPDELRDPDKTRSDAEAYKRLLAGLDRSEVVIPDDVAREAVKQMAAASDHGTGYAEVVAEHDALHGLLALLEGRDADVAR